MSFVAVLHTEQKNDSLRPSCAIYDRRRKTEFGKLVTNPVSTERDNIALRFAKLAREWKSDTQLFSSLTNITEHPAYQEIIKMGIYALPYIFEELDREPGHWFSALNAITGANPIKPDHRGRMALMTADWQAWRRKNLKVK